MTVCVQMWQGSRRHSHAHPMVGLLSLTMQTLNMEAAMQPAFAAGPAVTAANMVPWPHKHAEHAGLRKHAEQQALIKLMAIVWLQVWDQLQAWPVDELLVQMKSRH